MKTLISLIWFICGVVMAFKWFGNKERSVMRFGSARNRMTSAFWDWLFYLFLSLIILAIPFGLILLILGGIGKIIKIVFIIAVIGIAIYLLYSLITKNKDKK